ncbi:flagellar hook protein FlgE [Photobacterium damselae]|uniref:flagellar hook protein FlgE n=1 Tax=Photobacterium damselae TaxID=38293 RepID=UPI0023D90584|nr:flagellar hook protein FlgE [Photobacterium damselae]ELI6446831.1 flagellar hook protein FlgE [Photobacterium damselae]WIH18753.1 flagellar hook protein FlgE [Photobacterium damselae]
MSVNIALSGLGAAQKDLNTTSNNIANANTYGFKESRAEFGDVYSNSIFSNAKTSTGGGVQTSTVAQQFHEGSSLYTNNPLDLRISGAGFFAVADNKAEPANNSLTRNGAFHLNNQNELVNSEGKFLLGYDVNSDTNTVSSYEPKSMKIDDVFGQPTKSNNINISLNLPNKAVAPKNSPFDFNDPDSFSRSTSSTIYDSLGKPYKITTYYVAKYNPNAPAGTNKHENEWGVFQTITNSSGTETPLNPKIGSLPNGYEMQGAAHSINGVSREHLGYIMKFDSNGQLYKASDSALKKSVNDAAAGLASLKIELTSAPMLKQAHANVKSSGEQVSSALDLLDPSKYPQAAANKKEIDDALNSADNAISNMDTVLADPKSTDDEKLVAIRAVYDASDKASDAAQKGVNLVDQANAHGDPIYASSSPTKIEMETFSDALVDVGGADNSQALTMNYLDPTQYASAFEVRKFEDADGATTGHLSKVDIDPDGNVLASYSNGKDRIVGRVAMARVSNEQGLSQLGGTLWNVTQESGDAVWGDASQGSFGSIKSGTLEQSNIDMTQELVDLITAQRNFQASSRALEVNNQLQQNILQIR